MVLNNTNSKISLSQILQFVIKNILVAFVLENEHIL